MIPLQNKLRRRAWLAVGVATLLLILLAHTVWTHLPRTAETMIPGHSLSTAIACDIQLCGNPGYKDQNSRLALDSDVYQQFYSRLISVPYWRVLFDTRASAVSIEMQPYLRIYYSFSDGMRYELILAGNELMVNGIDDGQSLLFRASDALSHQKDLVSLIPPFTSTQSIG